MANRGGKRPGAGRPKGSKNKLTKAVLAKASQGQEPLDYLLQIMRDENEEPALRLDAAKAAAQFCHPRLSAVQTNLVEDPLAEAMANVRKRNAEKQKQERLH